METELTKQERIDLQREEKQRAKEKMIRIKKIKKWIPWVVFIGAAVGLIFWASMAAQNSNQSRPGEAVPVMGRNHIQADAAHEPYNSNPPTSGPHASDVPWGVHEEEIPDVNAIHNLEHGGIWISYKDLDEQSVAALQKIAAKNSSSVILSPRAANDSPVAVASWGRLMKLDTVDVAKITEYIRMNKNKSPEPLAR